MLQSAEPKGEKIPRRNSRPPRGKGSDYVYQALRRTILRMELAPGEKIDEASIVKQLGVSRTPVREAIIRLSADRLVVVLPNRGAQVAPLDFLDLSNYFESLELTQRALQHWACLRRSKADLAKIDKARIAYEKSTAKRDTAAMSERNLEFHQAVAKASGNQIFSEFDQKLSSIGIRIGWIWYQSFAEGELDSEFTRMNNEHRLILKAITDRNTEEAESLAQAHIGAFHDRVVAKLGARLGNVVSIQAPDA